MFPPNLLFFCRILRFGSKTLGDFPELKKEVEELASQKSVRFAYGALVQYYKKVNEKELLQKVRANSGATI